MSSRKSWCRKMIAAGSTSLLAVVLCAAPAAAQDPLEDAAQMMKETMQRIIVPKTALTDGPHMHAAFREVVARPSQATVRVFSGGKQVALGTIVDADGYIVTKASQLQGDLTCRLKDGRQLKAQLVGVKNEYDLALLKIDAKELPAITWADATATAVGQWAVTPGLGRDPVAIGVVSVLPREIPKPSGILGVVLDEDDAGPLIVHVLPDSGAARAGLQVNDVVTHCNGQLTESREALVNLVRKFSPGDEIKITIVRDAATLEFKAVLTAEPGGKHHNRREVQNNMGSELSQRRNGFPQALQHDTVLRPADCGGPLVNLDGQALGVNVARAGRTESFAVPGEVVRKLVQELRATMN